MRKLTLLILGEVAIKFRNYYTTEIFIALHPDIPSRREFSFHRSQQKSINNYKNNIR